MHLDTLRNCRPPRGGEWGELARLFLVYAQNQPATAAKIEAMVLEPNGKVTVTSVSGRGPLERVMVPRIHFAVRRRT